MKQKLLNDVLYVYSLEPYIITKDTSASVIYVQEELFNEYKALNPELTQLAKKNYNLLAVMEPEWNEYIHQKVDPDFEWSSSTATAQIGETNTYPTITNGDDVTISYASTDTNVAIVSNEGAITLVGKGTCSISATYQGDNEWFNAKTVSYTLTVLAAKVNYLFESYNSDGTVKYGEGEAQSTGIETQTMIEIEVLSNHSTDPNATNFVGQKFFIQNDAVADTSVLYPLYDANGEGVGISVKVNKTNKLDADLYWSEATATVQIGETNTLPTLVNNCDVDLTFSSSDSTVATINTLTGEITLVGAGQAIISAIFGGDALHAAETQTYTLTVLAQKVSPNLSWSASTTTVQIGENNTFPTLSNPNNVEVTLSSNDTTKMTVSANGAITLIGEGSVKIIATHQGSTYYLPQIVEATLNILPAKVSPNLSWTANEATVQVGETNTFPTLNNTNSQVITYASSDTDVASINENGDITLKTEGKVTITASTEGNTYFLPDSATYTLTVLRAKVSPNLTFSTNQAEVQYGETNTYPTLINTNNVEVTYSISGLDGYATINSSTGEITLTNSNSQYYVNGYVTATFSGSTYYSAQSTGYSLYILGAKIDAGLAWSDSTATVQINESNSFPTLTNPNSLTVSYSSSDTNVATIYSNGTISLVGAGTTTIEATFSGNTSVRPASVTYTLTVLAAKVSPNLSWSDSTASAQIGETNSYPTLSNANSVSVSYTSSDTSVATIASDGTVTLVAAGSTTISAVFSGNTTYSAQTVTYTLTVLAAKVSPNLAWSTNSATVRRGEEGNVFPTLSNPNSVSVVYGTSNNSIATIDSQGEITLIASGSVTISAYFSGNTTYNAQTVTYTLTVSYRSNPNLSWSSNSATVTINDSNNSFPTLSNFYGMPITYTSSDTTKATIASDGTITLLEAGTTNISASFNGNDYYRPQTVTYELTVNPASQVVVLETLSVTTKTVTINADTANQSKQKTIFEIPDYQTQGFAFNSADWSFVVADTTVCEVTSCSGSTSSNGQDYKLTLTLTCKASGTTTITATFTGDSTFDSGTYTSTVTIYIPQPAQTPDYSWSNSTVTIDWDGGAGDPTGTNPNSLTGAQASGATGLTLTYSSNDTGLVEVDSSTGEITVVHTENFTAGGGSVSITVSNTASASWAAHSDTYAIYFENYDDGGGGVEPQQTIGMSGESFSMKPGDSTGNTLILSFTDPNDGSTFSINDFGVLLLNSSYENDVFDNITITSVSLQNDIWEVRGTVSASSTGTAGDADDAIIEYYGNGTWGAENVMVSMVLSD